VGQPTTRCFSKALQDSKRRGNSWQEIKKGKIVGRKKSLQTLSFNPYTTEIMLEEGDAKNMNIILIQIKDRGHS
jgi:hypothetical protein